MKARKRDGTEEEFNIVKIINAIKKANKATEENKLEPLTDEKGKCCKKCADAFKNKAQGKIHDNEWWRKDNRLVGYKIY